MFDAIMGMFQTSPPDGTDGKFKQLLVDIKGRLVTAMTIGGVAPQLDDTDKIAVSNYGKNAAAGDIALNANSSGDQEIDLVKIKGVSAPQLDDTDKIAVSLHVATAGGAAGAFSPSGAAGSADGTTAAYPALHANARSYVLNGSTWDRQRGNVEGTALASAARTANTFSPDIINYNGRTLSIFLDVTSVTSTPEVTLGIQIKDPVTGDYEQIWTAAAAAAATGEFVYQLGPGLLAGAGGGYDDTENIVIPRTFIIAVSHADTDSITYSIGYSLNV